MQTSLDGFERPRSVLVTVAAPLIAKIRSAAKQVEFRKVWPTDPIQTIWFCEKGSGGRVVLRARVESASVHPSVDAWRLHGPVAGVTEAEFFAYVEPSRSVYCILLKNVQVIHDTLVRDLGALKPPQNYTFVHQ
jgi:predicted transcriptional regulator